MMYQMIYLMSCCRSLLLVVLTLAAGTGAWAISFAAEAQVSEPAASSAADSAPAATVASPKDAAQQSAAGKTANAKAQQRTSGDTKTPATRASAKGASGADVVRSSGKRDDRLDLDASVITGNRELPKVMYIVPWKKAEPGDLPAQPFNTLLDEALTPVDRDVFRREVTYYGAVSATANSTDDNSPPVARRLEK